MPKYKEIFELKEKRQKDLLKAIHLKDSKVDKSLLSKIVNYYCLPTPIQLKEICNYLECEPLDIYTIEEIQLINEKSIQDEIPTNSGIALPERVATEPHPLSKRARAHRSRRRNNNLYMLSVELDREIAEKVFNPESMKKLRIHDRSDFIRKCVYKLYQKLLKIEEKEKSPTSANVSDHKSSYEPIK